MLKIGLRLMPLLLTILLAGCGTTAQISNAWVAPDVASKNLKGVLVVAVAKKEETRISFEDAFTKKLIAEGAHAVASHTLFDGDAEKGEVLAVAKLAGLSTILVTRYAGTVDEQVLHPGATYYEVVPDYGADYRGGFGGRYGYSYAKAYSDPDVWTTNSYVSLVCDLYDSFTEEALWKASSVAIDPKDYDELQEAFISAFVKQMIKQKLLD
jgi:hypothetical protein